ncbi:MULTISPECIES: Na+/H+ antiporter subunit C [Marinobacter]|jgi:multicomponent K+:H+ antiporter subunit C|uniref:NADH-ubiquinone oxidoreductase, chain 4L n=1 Tax=Marinobacter manganoxydans MnI7-9 TaxID=1094979 RepID=G6YUZ9_9GAMM|nr:MULTISPECIES: Na+/H+ antiporter subunit C [Marinobacter]MCP4062419.1 Na+/H+ antiporter subunit C [Gammaproteobacteria bacterium]HAS78002.1 Na+/H+ antiporter subunit C [Marinobacter adhaerens]AKV95263.1 NADH-ubiquinone oxidoreductase subunit 4L [Marinobacter sp. CP1]EHJ04124.1 NADH-ubiquinone oxidoreductase, chain 4L [Marinobacter manganoxydans MnI7-9]MAK48630.1 Na+/H+ antiporter subunit C [Marinobacter sp.]|tara:strand:- start:8686 stop:9054 length:369 start_codon:yes stop_codon:yes gene_type:complete
MELVFALVIGALTSSGVYLILRARTFPVVVGLTLLSYGVNLFLFSSGRLATGQQPIIGTAASYSDPLPQALVLTAIVIGFAMTAFVVVLSLRNLADNEDDHVDGKQPYKSPAPEEESEVTGK